LARVEQGPHCLLVFEINQRPAQILGDPREAIGIPWTPGLLPKRRGQQLGCELAHALARALAAALELLDNCGVEIDRGAHDARCYRGTHQMKRTKRSAVESKRHHRGTAVRRSRG